MPTLNCEKKIRRSLESVKWADEIIIVDMQSTDKTVKIAENYNAIVFRKIPTLGNFDQNRKFGMDHATSEWILKLDSDEEITKNLADEIKTFLKHDDGQYNGINFYNRIIVFGKEIKHGFVKPGSHETRMVRRGFWNYDPYKFHQQITVTGRTIFFKNRYIHYNFSDVSEFLLKTNKYTNLDASISRDKNRANPILIALAPIKTFFKLFFLQNGILDGFVGFELSFLFACYNLIEKTKIWELQNKND